VAYHRWDPYGQEHGCDLRAAGADTAQKAFSVAKIEHPEVMDEHGKQKVGGLMDPKMGSMLFSPRPEPLVAIKG
jgi:hypothetical protein